MITAVFSMYSSRAPMSSRSSTSRKTDTPVSSKESCRLMVAHWSCPVPLVPLGERQVGPVAGREKAERGDLGRLNDRLHGERGREDKRAKDADKEAGADDELVEVQAVVQLARVHRLADGLDLEHGAEYKNGREREVASHREVVVLLPAVWLGDGRAEHEDEAEDDGDAQLHDGVGPHADHDAHEEELLELLGDLPAVHARLKVAVQEGECRGEARRTIPEDGPTRTEEEQQVQRGDADRIQQDGEEGEVDCLRVLGAAAPGSGRCQARR
eukprot:scaffold54347_cov66-Phaeocystis_antarctica.AAC.5